MLTKESFDVQKKERFNVYKPTLFCALYPFYIDKKKTHQHSTAA